MQNQKKNGDSDPQGILRSGRSATTKGARTLGSYMAGTKGAAREEETENIGHRINIWNGGEMTGNNEAELGLLWKLLTIFIFFRPNTTTVVHVKGCATHVSSAMARERAICEYTSTMDDGHKAGRQAPSVLRARRCARRGTTDRQQPVATRELLKSPLVAITSSR